MSQFYDKNDGKIYCFIIFKLYIYISNYISLLTVMVYNISFYFKKIF